jgi:hypothetical protein
MNTKQMIALWYGGLAVLVLILAGERSAVTLSAAAVVLLLLIVYSFSKRHHVSKHKVILAIMLPFCLLGIASFIFEGSTYYPDGLPPPNTSSMLPQDGASLQDTQFHHRFFMDRFSGKVQNNSNLNLNTVVIRFSLTHASGKVEDVVTTLKGFNIAPGQSAPFSQTLLGLHPRAKGQWKWSAQVLGATGTPPGPDSGSG